ncbi:UNVERIFIED_CONTAM: hypothetical protein K2H54_058045 [Gekko kuhli]
MRSGIAWLGLAVALEEEGAELKLRKLGSVAAFGGLEATALWQGDTLAFTGVEREVDRPEGSARCSSSPRLRELLEESSFLEWVAVHQTLKKRPEAEEKRNIVGGRLQVALQIADLTVWRYGYLTDNAKLERPWRPDENHLACLSPERSKYLL